MGVLAAFSVMERQLRNIAAVLLNFELNHFVECVKVAHCQVKHSF